MREAEMRVANFSQASLEHLDALYGYALVLTRDRTDAEDLVQDTYVRAIGAIGQLEPNSNLKGWLFVIMRNAWLNQVRHDRSGPRFIELGNDERAPVTALGFNPQLSYLRKLEYDEIREAIENLPDPYREIVVLRDVEGFSYQEIATMLNCPAGTVMSRLGRAREKLRAMLSGWQQTKAAGAI